MPVEENLELISQQLDLLEMNQLIAKQDREKILAELTKEPSKIKEYAKAFEEGVPSITEGVIALVKLGKDGDPYEISIASLSIFSGVVAMAGPLLGPAGPIFSALSGMVSMILGAFLPKPPNLKDQIEELLNKFVAEEKLRALGTAADQIWVLSDTIEHHSCDYKPLNLQNGTEIKAIDDAWQWLMQAGKGSVPQWDQVLEKTCMVWLQLMRYIALCVAKPSTREGVKKGDVLVYLPARQELFLKHLRSIKPLAQERGLYVMFQGWQDFGNILYIAVGREGALPWEYKKNTDWMVNFSIHVPKDQLGSSTPRYDLITCGDSAEHRTKKIVRHHVNSVTGDLQDGHLLMADGQEYPNIQGTGSRRFEGCINAWAFPDSSAPKMLRVYTAHSDGAGNYVNIHLVDSDNNARRVNWEPHPGGRVEHIRALQRDISQSLPDDPDAKEISSRQYEIIYGGYRGSPNIWVETDNDWRDVPSPWGEYNGIEIDPYCLWVFGAKGLACATHASVIHAFLERKAGKPASPKWISFNTGWKDGFNVRSLCACGDGILALGSDQPTQQGLFLLTGTYKIKLKEPRSIEWKYQGATREGSPKQIQKMAIPCWLLFAQVLRDLEKQVGEHPHD